MMQGHLHLILFTFEPTKSLGIFSYRIAICDSKRRPLRFILISWCKSAIYVKVPQIKLRLKKKATAIHLDKLVQKCDLCICTSNQVNMLNHRCTWKLHLNLKELLLKFLRGQGPPMPDFPQFSLINIFQNIKRFSIGSCNEILNR